MVSELVAGGFPEGVLERVDRFSRIINRQGTKNQRIEAIYYSKGDFEEEVDTLFFILDSGVSYDRNLSGKITKLEIEIMKDFNFNLHILEWPCGYENVGNYGFKEQVFDYTNPSNLQ